jgi:hypothetical protein
LKRFLHLSALLLVCLLYGTAKSPDAIVFIRPYWFDLYKLGDLYRYCYLAEYRDTTEHCPPPPKEKPDRMDLFVIGDSFAGPFTKDHFPKARNYGFANWNHTGQSDLEVRLDTGAYNVLVLECSEKHVLMRFEEPAYKAYRFPVRPKTGGEIPEIHYSEKKESFLEKLEKTLGRQAVTEQNLGILLFSNPWVLRLKETKAALNRSLFGRVADEVEEYPEKNMLVQRMTSDTKYRYMSSFRAHPESEYRKISENLEKMADYYRSKGFDTVLLALVPNPIAVIDPTYKGRIYNQLLPWMEKNTPGLGIVSVYGEFKEGKETLFRRGDSHWNVKGERIWMGKVNEGLGGLGKGR